MAPSGNPTTEQTPTPVPRSRRAASATQVGIDAHRGELVLSGLPAQALDLGGGGVGLEQRVVDEAGNRPAAAPGPVQAEPGGAGVETSCTRVGTAVHLPAVTAAARRRMTAVGRQFLGDDGDQAAQIDADSRVGRRGHRVRSRPWIFPKRRM